MKPTPVNLNEFRLTVPLPCPTGKPLRVAMGGSDRPWCVAQHVSLLPQSGNIWVPYTGVTGNLGGRVGEQYVRDIGYDTALLELGRAMSATLPDARRRIWRDALGNRPKPSHRLTANLMGYTLDEYQLSTVNASTNAGMVIALAVGLGKTLVALMAAYDAYTEACHTWGGGTCGGNLVVVCPLNAMPVWKDPKVVAWAQSMFGNYSVISADSLHKIQAMQNTGPAVLIIDEAHYFGSVSAQRTKLMHKIRWQFDACFPLTGSMLHAGPEKVLSLLDLACPGAALFGNLYEFGQQFECLYSKDIGNGVMKKQVGRPPEKYKEQFQKYLDRFVVAKTKRSPDVMVSLYVPEQELNDVCLYDTKTAPSMLDEAGAMAIELFQRDKAIPSMIAVVHALARAGVDAKLEWLIDMMDGFTEQIVLFATYHDTLDATEAWLKSEGIAYCRIDGEVTGPQRTILIDDFRASKYQVMLAQTDAASVSMNLQTASISVMMDTTQKAMAFEQALGRTCRRGSTDLCHHFNLAGNRFQSFVFNRLKNAMDFNASVAEWQDAKRIVEQTLLSKGATP